MKIPNVLAMTVSSILPVLAVEPPFLDPATLTAWCVVPFDSKKRVPEERARMLQGLGFKKFAYDWREENVATFDQEVVALKTQGVELVAWWFPTHAENAHARVILDVIKR